MYLHVRLQQLECSSSYPGILAKAFDDQERAGASSLVTLCRARANVLCLSVWLNTGMHLASARLGRCPAGTHHSRGAVASDLGCAGIRTSGNCGALHAV